MNYNQKIRVTTFIGLSFSLFVACSNSEANSMLSNSEIIFSSTASTTTPLENIADETINLLLISMGQPDEELIAILGEGTVVQDETGTVVNRLYERVILDELVTISVNLSTNHTVSSATLTLKNGTFEDWIKKLTNAIGEVSILDKGLGISIAEWNLSCAVTTLQQTETLELIFVALPT